jgi:nucleotide-binding universal stress UspA family protein
VIRKNIKNILVPLDGSKNSLRGLDNAISIARACQATITAVYVIPLYPKNIFDTLMPYYIHPIKEAKKFMANAKKHAAQKGILLKSKIINGSPTKEIQDLSNSKKFDLIVIGARGLGSIKEVFLGSVSHAILHKARIPVLVSK